MSSSSDSSVNALLRGNTNLIVLAILRDGPAHGYAIAAEVAKRSMQLVEFKQGTLYPLLHELERDAFICSEWEINPGERPRRVYKITESGLEELAARRTAWMKFSEVIHSIVEVTPDESGSKS
jgi:PadR family transcriptional regulator, regulatory protein PadR